MHAFHLIGILLLLASLPAPILAYGSTIHSIIDSTLEDAPEYLIANAERTQVQSVKSLVRSCPFLFYETLLDGKVVHTLSTCINVTGLMMTTQIQVAKKLEIERAKLVIYAQIKKDVVLDFKLGLSAPVFDGVYAHTWIGRIPVGWLQGLIIGTTRERIESELRSFLSSLK